MSTTATLLGAGFGRDRRSPSYTRRSNWVKRDGVKIASATVHRAGATPHNSTNRRPAARAFSGFSTLGLPRATRWSGDPYHTPVRGLAGNGSVSGETETHRPSV